MYLPYLQISSKKMKVATKVFENDKVSTSLNIDSVQASFYSVTIYYTLHQYGLHKRNSGSALFLLLTIFSMSRFLLEVDIVVLAWTPWVAPRPRPEWTSGVRPSFERWNPSVWWQAELMRSSIAHSLDIRLKKSHGSEKVGGFSFQNVLAGQSETSLSFFSKRQWLNFFANFRWRAPGERTSASVRSERFPCPQKDLALRRRDLHLHCHGARSLGWWQTSSTQSQPRYFYFCHG